MLSQFVFGWPTLDRKLTSSPGCLLHAYLPSIRFVFIVAPEVLNRNSTARTRYLPCYLCFFPSRFLIPESKGEMPLGIRLILEVAVSSIALLLADQE